LIGPTGEQIGVVNTNDALVAARENDLDLVLIADSSDPPVAKIMDFGKRLYEEKKAKAAAKKKQHQLQVKEIKFRPGTDIGDYQVKLRNLVRFLEDGDKAKVTIRFRVVKWPTKNSACKCSSAWKRTSKSMELLKRALN